MFPFPRLPSLRLWIHRRIPPLWKVGSPIRKSPDQSLLAAPRGISVLAPSFIGSWRLGIRRAPYSLDQKPRRIDTTSDRFAPSRSGGAPRPSTCQDRQVVRLRFVVRPPIPPPGGGVSTDTLDA